MKGAIPRDTPNLVRDLLAAGVTKARLAVECDVANTSTVEKWLALSVSPGYDACVHLARLAGWKSGGEVMDWFKARVGGDK